MQNVWRTGSGRDEWRDRAAYRLGDRCDGTRRGVDVDVDETADRSRLVGVPLEQADSASRIRWLITAETPSPRIETP